MENDWVVPLTHGCQACPVVGQLEAIALHGFEPQLCREQVDTGEGGKGLTIITASKGLS